MIFVTPCPVSSLRLVYCLCLTQRVQDANMCNLLAVEAADVDACVLWPDSGLSQ